LALQQPAKPPVAPAASHHSRAKGRRSAAQPSPDRPAAPSAQRTNQQGGAFKRKDDMYRMAQANKAFAHYRW